MHLLRCGGEQVAFIIGIFPTKIKRRAGGFLRNLPFRVPRVCPGARWQAGGALFPARAGVNPIGVRVWLGSRLERRPHPRGGKPPRYGDEALRADAPTGAFPPAHAGTTPPPSPRQGALYV
jgi:hypothetical protein